MNNLDDLREELETREDRMNIMMSNTDYINWIINFMNDRSEFYDEEWDYSEEKLSKNDQDKVNDLALFFEGIFHYARFNDIDSLFRPLGECFHIKMNDNYFEIGYITGQGTSFYCKKINQCDEDIIDFMDIIDRKVKTKIKKI